MFSIIVHRSKECINVLFPCVKSCFHRLSTPTSPQRRKHNLFFSVKCQEMSPYGIHARACIQRNFTQPFLFKAHHAMPSRGYYHVPHVPCIGIQVAFRYLWCHQSEAMENHPNYRSPKRMVAATEYSQRTPETSEWTA